MILTERAALVNQAWLRGHATTYTEQIFYGTGAHLTA